MFFTTPFTTAPSFSVSRSCWRSTPAVSFITARRETTTLLRLRSSLITLNSSSLFSKCDVSLTGRRSTSEPGRKARMPFTMTVRPPFTLPLTTPLMMVPLASASSRLVHAASFFALSREGFDGDRHEVAGLHFDLAAVVLEFFGRDGAFGLQSRIDDHHVGVDRDDLGGDHFTDAHFLAREALFEERGEAVFE